MTRRLEATTHELDRGIEVIGSGNLGGHDQNDLGIAGTVGNLVLLADNDSILHTHADASIPTSTPANKSCSSSAPGISPTSERARIQSSQG